MKADVDVKSVVRDVHAIIQSNLYWDMDCINEEEDWLRLSDLIDRSGLRQQILDLLSPISLLIDDSRESAEFLLWGLEQYDNKHGLWLIETSKQHALRYCVYTIMLHLECARASALQQIVNGELSLLYLNGRLNGCVQVSAEMLRDFHETKSAAYATRICLEQIDNQLTECANKQNAIKFLVELFKSNCLPKDLDRMSFAIKELPSSRKCTIATDFFFA